MQSVTLKTIALSPLLQGLQSAKDALSDFFLKKKSRLQRLLLESLMRRVPRLVPDLLSDVLRQAATARNEYLRLEASLLLAVALKVRQSCCGSHPFIPLYLSMQNLLHRAATEASAATTGKSRVRGPLSATSAGASPAGRRQGPASGSGQ